MTPVDVMLIGSVPLLIVATYLSWLKWRNDHRAAPPAE
jgi:hypothetical protein